MRQTDRQGSRRNAARVNTLASSRNRSSDGWREFLAAKDILPDEGHKGCMFRIMIQSVAEADALEDEPGGLTDDLAEARVASAVSLIVQAGHVLAECIGEYRGWSEHDRPLPS